MTEKCRICMEESSLELLERLSHDRRGRVIWEMMEFVSGIEIDGRLPAFACHSCLSKLTIAFDMKTLILKTEEALKELSDSALYPIEQVIVDESDRQETIERAEITIPPEKKNRRPSQLDYTCHICNVTFSKVGAKNLHVKSDHLDDSLCSICNKKFKTPMSLETHIKFHFKHYEFLCEICSKTFRYSNRLEIHMKLHHSESSMFACDLCGLTTKFKNNIKRHMKAVHMGLRLFSCDRCDGQEYSTQIALNGHLLRVHGITESKIAKERRPADFEFIERGPNSSLLCKICGDAFLSREKGRIHFYLKHKHSNKCEECDIVFNNFPALTRHKKVKHQGHKPFKCDICEKTFGQKVSLASHRNSHTKEKPFSCQHCDYRSGDYSSISRHKKRVHSETKSSKV